MQLHQNLKLLQRTITCPICLDYYDIPVSLKSCGHSFCFNCLNRAISVRSVCPMCVITCSAKDVIKCNYLIDIIKDISELVTLSQHKYSQQLKTDIDLRPNDENEKLNHNLMVTTDLHSSSTKFQITSTSNDNIEIMANDHTNIQSVNYLSNDNNNNIHDTEVVPLSPHHHNHNHNHSIDHNEKIDISPMCVQSIKYEINEVVEVIPRTWAGINKPGGAAWIIGIHEDDNTYDVKYILTSKKEKNLSAIYIQSPQDINRQDRRRSMKESYEAYDDTTSISISKRRKIHESHISTPTISTTSSSTHTMAATTMNSTTTISTTSSSAPMVILAVSGLNENDNQFINTFLSVFPNAQLVMHFEQYDTLSIFSTKYHSKNTPSYSGNGLSTTAADATTTSNSSHNTHFITNYDTITTTSNNSNSSCRLNGYKKKIYPVTHLIVPTNETNIFPQRTIKYLQAIIDGIWIVSIEWIKQCLKKKKFMKEDKYEIYGCSKSLLLYIPRLARLYKKTTIYKDESDDRLVLNRPLFPEQNSIIINPTTTTISSSSSSSSSSSWLSTSNNQQQQQQQLQRSGLFSNIIIYFHGYYPSPHPPRSQLEYLMIHGSAIIISSLSNFLNLCIQSICTSTSHQTSYILSDHSDSKLLMAPTRNDLLKSEESSTHNDKCSDPHKVIICLDHETYEDCKEQIKQYIENLSPQYELLYIQSCNCRNNDIVCDNEGQNNTYKVENSQNIMTEDISENKETKDDSWKLHLYTSLCNHIYFMKPSWIIDSVTNYRLEGGLSVSPDINCRIQEIYSAITSANLKPSSDTVDTNINQSNDNDINSVNKCTEKNPCITTPLSEYLFT